MTNRARQGNADPCDALAPGPADRLNGDARNHPRAIPHLHVPPVRTNADELDHHRSRVGGRDRHERGDGGRTHRQRRSGAGRKDTHRLQAALGGANGTTSEHDHEHDEEGRKRAGERSHRVV